MTNGEHAAAYLKKSHPSDEIYLDEDAYTEMHEFRNSIVGEELDLISDVIWSGTVPMMDFIINSSGWEVRYCIFEDAMNALDEVPEGKTAMVGAMEFVGLNEFMLLGVVKGEMRADVSLEVFNKWDGSFCERASREDLAKKSWKLWHAVQLALLHPKTKEVFSHPRQGKVYTREKTPEGKRKRVTRYIRRHVIDGEEVKRSTREIHRHCLAWYVVGHWRHYKNGNVVYIKGHWKGKLRALKQNADQGRTRIIAT